MIRELKNPLNNITWNCKNNYDVYTTDYDPEHSHFDRISMDIMDVQKIMNEIGKLEDRRKLPWTWTMTDRDTDTAALNSLKESIGLPKWEPAGKLTGLDIPAAINEAVESHANSNER